MDNDIIMINNPYAKLLPDSDGLNDIIRHATPSTLHNYYRLGYVHGVMLDSKHNEDIPFAVRKFAKYNKDFLRNNQEDGQSIIFEDTSYYNAIKGSGKGKLVCNHHHYLSIDPAKAYKGNQATGDCVSWAIRSALDELRCRTILGGKWEAYVCRQATCGIYSGRGHTGQGADPVGLSAWAIKIGTLLEKEYKTSVKTYDFSDYDNYVSWGISRGRSGVPSDLLEFTKPYTAENYKVISSTDALADLLFSGGTAHCGSMLGVSSTGNPISRKSGAWSHDMTICGFDDTDAAHQQFGGRVWLWENSWGSWNSVSNIPDRWKPWGEGMFALSEKDTQWAVSDGGTCVFFAGKWFPADPITNAII